MTEIIENHSYCIKSTSNYLQHLVSIKCKVWPTPISRTDIMQIYDDGKITFITYCNGCSRQLLTSDQTALINTISKMGGINAIEEYIKISGYVYES